MMSYVMGALMALGFLFSLFLGRMNELSGAVLESGVSAIKLCIELCGTLALWSGIMRIAERAGLCGLISRIMAPLTNRLFPGLRDKSPRAIASITLNITANLLGLGAAATPMALDAMAELDRINGGAQTACNDMIVFVALNTASFQILPTTVATIRRLAGCANPMDIIPCVWISSAVSVSVAVGSALLLNKRRAAGK